MIKYITIIDPNGGEYGAERTPVSVNHRLLYENKRFYGYESIRKLFRHEIEMTHLLAHIVAHPNGSSGQCGDLLWSVDDK